MNPDMMGDQGQGADPDASGDQAGDPMEVLNQLGQGLMMVIEGLGRDKAPQEILAPFQAALEAFSAGVQMLQGGAQAESSSPVEAGGASVAPSGNNQMRG